MALSLELEDRNEIRGVDQRFVFAKFLRTETAFVGALTKRINPFLNWRIDAKVDETPRGLRVEASAQGVQKTIQDGSSTHDPTLARDMQRRVSPRTDSCSQFRKVSDLVSRLQADLSGVIRTGSLANPDLWSDVSRLLLQDELQ